MLVGSGCKKFVVVDVHFVAPKSWGRVPSARASPLMAQKTVATSAAQLPAASLHGGGNAAEDILVARAPTINKYSLGTVQVARQFN